jgi:excisionase family DNA binding protein
MSPLRTYQEAADYLRISLATIDRMVRANELPSVLIRGRRLFRIRDLLASDTASRLLVANSPWRP